MGVLKRLLDGSSFWCKNSQNMQRKFFGAVRESKHLYVCTAPIGLAAFILNSDKVKINSSDMGCLFTHFCSTLWRKTIPLNNLGVTHKTLVLCKLYALSVVSYFHATKPFHNSLLNVFLSIICQTVQFNHVNNLCTLIGYSNKKS